MHLSSNQNGSLFYIVTPENGLELFFTKTLKKIDLALHPNVYKGIEAVEMLYNSNLVAMVGGKYHSQYQDSQLVLYECMKNEPYLLYNFGTRIERVQMDWGLLMVAQRSKIMVFQLEPAPDRVPLLTVEKKFSPADGGWSSKKLCDIATVTSNGNRTLKLAYLGSQPGFVRVISCPLQKSKFGEETLVVRAHNSGIACIGFSRSGKYLATASELGTVVRVFFVESGKLLQEFRRGMQRATVYDLRFSFDDKVLLVSSSSKTVHLFDLSHSLPTVQNTESDYGELVVIDSEDLEPPEIALAVNNGQSYTRNISSLVNNYFNASLPASVKLQHSFAQIKVNCDSGYFTTFFIEHHVDTIFAVLTSQKSLTKYLVNPSLQTVVALSGAESYKV